MNHASPHRIVRPGWLILLVFLPGVAAAWAAYYTASLRDRSALADAFHIDAGQRLHHLTVKTQHLLDTVGTVQALYKASKNVERAEFDVFYATMAPAGSGMIGIAWCPRVPRAEIARHEEQVRKEGSPDYRVRGFGGRPPAPPTDPADCFPVAFAAPKSQAKWQGLDLMSMPAFRLGIQQACDSGDRTVTRMFDPQRPSEQTGMVIVLAPYYGSAEVPRSVQERQAKFRGVVGSVLDLRVLLLESDQDPHIPGIDMHLVDATDPAAPDLLASRLSDYRYDADSEIPAWAAPPSERLVRKADLPAGGRKWVISCVPTDRYLAERRSWVPLAAAVTCILLTAIVGWYANSLRGEAVQVERLVDERTAELRRVNEHLCNEVAIRRETELSLEEERNHLREMLDILEYDHRTIAYEIHDGFVQKAVGSLMLLQSLPEQLLDASTPVRQTVASATTLVSESVAEARQLIGGLRPAELDEQGVAAAMESLVETSRRRWAVDIELAQYVHFHRLSAPLETAIYRIVQESLNNAVKHSGSARVRIELTQPNGEVHIEVRDWGCGFDPGHVSPGHYGLEGIRERTRLFGGTLALESHPGEGTCIRVDLPLAGNHNGPARDPAGPVADSDSPPA